MNGTRISSTFDGKWVKTIVLTRPMRLARRAADSDETAASRFAAKKIAPRDGGLHAELQMEPVRHQALRDEPAAEGVEREERRETRERSRGDRAPSPSRRPMPSVGPRGRTGRLDLGPDPPEQDGHQDAHEGVADDDPAIGVERQRSRSADQGLADHALRPARPRPSRRSPRGCTRRTSASVRTSGIDWLRAACSMARNGLILSVGRADHADHSGQDEERRSYCRSRRRRRRRRPSAGEPAIKQPAAGRSGPPGS